MLTINTSVRTYELVELEELKAVKHGLVDFIRNARLVEDGYTIPCEVGYIERSDNTIEPTHIFIQTGCTDNGYCYYEQTIEL